MSENKPWVDEYLAPIHACSQAVEKANQYDSEQEAWSDWNDGFEMLWILVRMQHERSALIRCVCDIAEHTLDMFEKKHPNDKRPRQAIESARKVAENDTPENRDASYDAIDAAHASAHTADCVSHDAASAAARAAAYAATVAALASVGDYIAAAVAHAAAYTGHAYVVSRAAVAAARAATDVAAYAALASHAAIDVAHASYDDTCAAEKQWQADCVRKYFSKFPERKEMK